MPSTVKPCTVEQAGALAAIHAACFARAWAADAMAALLKQPGSFALIAGNERQEEAGFILCRMAADECELLTLAVRPQLQGLGAGRALVTAALAEARRRGAISMFLEVAADNAAAVHLYREAGFAPVAVRRGYYAGDGAQSKDALAKDALVMRRDLA